METSITMPLSSPVLKRIAQQAKDYLVSHGVVLRTVAEPLNGDTVIHAPVTLLPSPVPRHLYRQAQDIQCDINLLMHRIACDHSFMKRCLQNVIEVDDFTRRLWEIYDRVTKEGISQPYSLGLNRADYMFDCGQPTDQLIASGNKVSTTEMKLQQIEINLMASSFGGLSQQLDGYHRFILGRMQKVDQARHIPQNPAVDTLTHGMVEAWRVYGCTDAVVLFLVQAGERNIYDQRHLEYAIYKNNPAIQVIRRTMADMTERAKLENRKLKIDGVEVCVVYQRTLYTPEHYSSEQDWDMRLLIERSTAIKCPSAGYHLAGTKKVQQVLCQETDAMDRYIGPEAAGRVRETFAQQYSLDLDETGNQAVAMALAQPELFVLKPQREGGGNNVFGSDIPRVLKDMEPQERTAYILMRYIHPAPVRSYMLRPGQPIKLENGVSELGVFGAFLGTSDKVILNKSGGHILRTKTLGTMEGGVASGYSCLDSPYLID